MRFNLTQQWIPCIISLSMFVTVGLGLSKYNTQEKLKPIRSAEKYQMNVHIVDLKAAFLQSDLKAAAPPKPSIPKTVDLPLPTKPPINIPTIKQVYKAAPEAKAPLPPSTNVKSDSGLVEAHITDILKGTSLAGLGLEKAILTVEKQYGINAYFTIAVMKLESGNGTSKIAKNKNNLFGLNAIDGDAYNKAFSFKTKSDSVHKFGKLISEKYIAKGYTTIEKVSKKYCQANPKWPGSVKAIMKRDYSKAAV